MKETFSKALSANDVGTTGAHQAGILVPKTDAELLAFLPVLDPTVKNPDAWIECVDEDGIGRKFRFIYYNNRFHDPKGTRNEYRITHMTRYFRDVGAKEGDTLEISKDLGSSLYFIRIERKSEEAGKLVVNSDEAHVRIKITSSWRRVH
ncbi:EcoRII N-terminal effector-binding domain-containing protein [Serratia proteamaculans]|uniref:EcoRII N-terminal effector-binding domain-containing protein n=1 Tax=Serratia proteamaculans TaxID=28151 RepID=UPI0021C8DA15|nr:EcoRII N-terminal effector-binding domain-containing protein [Serratia proteamaculans]